MSDRNAIVAPIKGEFFQSYPYLNAIKTLMFIHIMNIKAFSFQ